MSIFTPVNQIRLTNVAVVRYKRKGKRFEIACYKNKVMNWRNNVETDLDEVLQSDRVFTNVSKGVMAKSDDLKRCFDTDDEVEVCKIILDKGQLQVSAKERQQDMESKLKDIITIIAQKCINSETKRPFPSRMIESALKEIAFVLKPKKSSKQQALVAIEQLKQVLTIERAQMRLRLEMPSKTGKAVKAALSGLFAAVEEEEFGAGECEMVVLIDPGSYRAVEEGFQQHTRGNGALEILDLQVRQDDEDDEEEDDEDEGEDEDEDEDDGDVDRGVEDAQEDEATADVGENLPRDGGGNGNDDGDADDDDDGGGGGGRGGTEQRVAGKRSSKKKGRRRRAKGKKDEDAEEDIDASHHSPEDKQQKSKSKSKSSQSLGGNAGGGNNDGDGNGDDDDDDWDEGGRHKHGKRGKRGKKNKRKG